MRAAILCLSMTMAFIIVCSFQACELYHHGIHGRGQLAFVAIPLHKKANKRLKANTSSRQITALQDYAGGLANTQQGLLQVAHDFFAAQAAAPTKISPGGPLPWEDVKLDAFHLTDWTTQLGAQLLDLHAHISNPALLHDLV